MSNVLDPQAFKIMTECRLEIERLLKERPEFIEFQNQIDTELKKAGTNPNNRAAALSTIAIEKQTELLTALNELTRETKKYVAACLKLTEL